MILLLYLVYHHCSNRRCCYGFYAFIIWQCRRRHCVVMSIHLSGKILLPQYLINGLSNPNETCGEYSLAHTDDMIRSWRSKVKVTEGSCSQIVWTRYLMNTWVILVKLSGNIH